MLCRSIEARIRDLSSQIQEENICTVRKELQTITHSQCRYPEVLPNGGSPRNSMYREKGGLYFLQIILMILLSLWFREEFDKDSRSRISESNSINDQSKGRNHHGQLEIQCRLLIVYFCCFLDQLNELILQVGDLFHLVVILFFMVCSFMILFLYSNTQLEDLYPYGHDMRCCMNFGLIYGQYFSSTENSYEI